MEDEKEDKKIDENGDEIIIYDDSDSNSDSDNDLINGNNDDRKDDKYSLESLGIIKMDNNIWNCDIFIDKTFKTLLPFIQCKTLSLYAILHTILYIILMLYLYINCLYLCIYYALCLLLYI